MTTFSSYFLLATWVFLLSQLIVLGAVYKRVRLGAPREGGPPAEPHGGGQPVVRLPDPTEAERIPGRKANGPQLAS